MGTYITPRLIPLASIIFSLWLILKLQINNHGNTAKKKSHTLLQTPRPTLSGLIAKFHVPGVRSGSQLILTGVDWFHSMMVRTVEVVQVMKIRT